MSDAAPNIQQPAVGEESREPISEQGPERQVQRWLRIQPTGEALVDRRGVAVLECGHWIVGRQDRLGEATEECALCDNEAVRSRLSQDRDREELKRT